MARPTYVWPPPAPPNEEILELALGCPFCGARPVEAVGMLRCSLHTMFMLPDEWNRRSPQATFRPTRPLLTAPEDREDQDR